MTLPVEKDSDLLEKVLRAFPSISLTDDDLLQNPKFCKLLAKVSKCVDTTGLTVPLQKDLEKAEEELEAARRKRMRPKFIVQALTEMVQEHMVAKHQTVIPAEGDKFYGMLERCLLAGMCHVQLQLGEEPFPVLGITAQHLRRVMPCQQDIKTMQNELPKELEKHIQGKAISILNYVQPESEKNSEHLKLEKINHLPRLLKEERNEIGHLQQQTSEMAFKLTWETQKYLKNLLEQMRLLQTLLLENRLKVQTQIDRSKLRYLEDKCQLGVQKIRLEMLEIQLDTYTPEKVTAHKKIREHLETELSGIQKEKLAAEKKLLEYEIFGQEFKDLVDEYTSLQVEIEAKKVAVETFTRSEAKSVM